MPMASEAVSPASAHNHRSSSKSLPEMSRSTRQAVQHYDGRVVPGTDPAGRQHFWLSVRPIEEAEEGTDRWALRQGLVSLTPLELDLTDHEALRRVQERLSDESRPS